MFENHLLRDLSEATVADIAAVAMRTPVVRGQVLQEQGVPAATSYFVESGRILDTRSAAGTRRHLRVAGPDSFVGPLLGGPPAPAVTEATAITDGVVLKVGNTALQAISERREDLRIALARHAQLRLDEAMLIAVCNTEHEVAARLSRWLLAISAQDGKPYVPLSQPQLAGLLGVQRTTVTSALALLSAQGAARSLRRRIEILDPAALERAACECHKAIARRAAELGLQPKQVSGRAGDRGRPPAIA